MFAALILAAVVAPVDPPAPLPDRWLLKLLPDKLPPLPDRFYTETWYHHAFAPRIGINWELWAEFRKAEKGRAAEAVLTRTGTDPVGFGGDWMLEHQPKRGHRTVPLAVHGPLVEFDRKLCTATVRTLKADPGRQPEREMLYLGSATEVKERVWYQAGTSTPRTGGKGALVEEWLIEFKEDPRTTDRGKAMLRGHWRVLTEPEGESFNAEVSFQAGNTYTKGRIVTLNWPHGMQQTRYLSRLEIEDHRGGSNDMRIDGMHRLSLYPAPKPRPDLPLEPAGLVQPPTKKVKK